MIRKLPATLAAAALVAAPVSATAATAQVSDMSGARAGAAMQDENQIEGAGVGLYIIGAIVIGLAAWGIYELVHNDNNDTPTSP
jgi:hypothetical protein